MLLGSVLAIATLAGFISYSLGREAIKGVNQLDIKPVKSKAGAVSTNPTGNNPAFLKESEIITKVRARIRGQNKDGKAKPSNS